MEYIILRISPTFKRTRRLRSFVHTLIRPQFTFMNENLFNNRYFEFIKNQQCSVYLDWIENIDNNICADEHTYTRATPTLTYGLYACVHSDWIISHIGCQRDWRLSAQLEPPSTR